MSVPRHGPIGLKSQVLEGAEIDAKADGGKEDMEVNLTQVQVPGAKGGVKRPRKPKQMKAVVEGGECTPKRQRKSRAKKVAFLDGEVADTTQQTPMPESEGKSEFTPPPPEWTPASQREWFAFSRIVHYVCRLGLRKSAAANCYEEISSERYSVDISVGRGLY
ncbi:hypothetical protein M758_UG149500 [Ceratodon purpureus]|nr:hypothetical protein M758_UG149500 [Ceratodon purpureus]